MSTVRVIFRWRREDGTIAAEWKGAEAERARLRSLALSNAVAWRRAGCRLFSTKTTSRSRS